jgi:hypothetical protein
MSEGYAPSKKEIPLLFTIYKLYEQQKCMYKMKVCMSLTVLSVYAGHGFDR